MPGVMFGQQKGLLLARRFCSMGGTVYLSNSEVKTFSKGNIDGRNGILGGACVFNYSA
jgi:hypothetical protein